MSLTDLQARLRADERHLLDKFAARVAFVERARPFFAIIAVAGGLIAAVSRAIAGDLGLGLTIGGAAFTALGGILVAVMDYRKLELGREAKDAYALADEAISAGVRAEQRLASGQAAADLLDRQRVHRLEALRLMREMMEQCLVGDIETEAAADTVLNVALVHIEGAIGFEAGEDWTLSVFAVDPSAEELVRVGAGWADHAAQQGGGRPWRKGEGYTGVAWRREEEVIEEDTSLPGKAEEYRVPPFKTRSYDTRRYRSIASVPIRTGSEQAIWGFVTATSDLVGRFKRNPDRQEVQAVEMVRDIAGMMSLLAIAERYAPDGDGDDGDDTAVVQ